MKVPIYLLCKSFRLRWDEQLPFELEAALLKQLHLQCDPKLDGPVVGGIGASLVICHDVLKEVPLSRA